MQKIFSRIIALLLVSCLSTDPSFAMSLFQGPSVGGHQRPVYSNLANSDFNYSVLQPWAVASRWVLGQPDDLFYLLRGRLFRLFRNENNTFSKKYSFPVQITSTGGGTVLFLQMTSKAYGNTPAKTVLHTLVHDLSIGVFGVLSLSVALIITVYVWPKWKRWRNQRNVNHAGVTNLQDYRKAKSQMQNLEHAIDRDIEAFARDLIELLSELKAILREWAKLPSEFIHEVRSSLREQRETSAPLGTVVTFSENKDTPQVAIQRPLRSWRMVWLENVRMFTMRDSEKPPESINRWLIKPLSAENLTQAIQEISQAQRGLWIQVRDRSSEHERQEIWIRSPGINWRRLIPEVLVTDRGIAQLHALLKKQLTIVENKFGFYYSDGVKYEIAIGAKSIFGWNIQVDFDYRTQRSRTKDPRGGPQAKKFSLDTDIPFSGNPQNLAVVRPRSSAIRHSPNSPTQHHFQNSSVVFLRAA